MALPWQLPPQNLPQHILLKLNDIIDSKADDKRVQYNMKVGLDQVQCAVRDTFTKFKLFNSEKCTFEDYIQSVSKEWNAYMVAIDEHKQVCKQTNRGRMAAMQSIEGIDLKVQAHRCPDDKIYKKHLFARQNMPRGNFIGKWIHPENESVHYFPLLRAYPKFSGHEDDGELEKNSTNEVEKYFTEPICKTHQVISTRKENGEAAHLAILKKISGGYTFIVGSKNVHLSVDTLDDLDEACHVHDAQKKMSYQAAKPIAIALLLLLSGLQNDHRNLFCDFLAYTRVTASFELLCPRHQHVESLDHLQRDTPVLYGFSLPRLHEQQLPGMKICMNPILGYELATAVGIQCVRYELLEYPMVSPSGYVLNTYAEEGRVFLFTNEKGHVIGMQKCKSAWYVSLRAIREKGKSFLRTVKKSKNVAESLEHTIKKVQSRFKAIQAFLDLPTILVSKYTKLGTEYMTYLSHLAEDEDSIDNLIEQGTNLFPQLWNQFLQHEHLSDDFRGI